MPETQKKFKSLAPANDIKGVDSYIAWLDEIVKDEHFGNIAMTGDLGIGKSSIVRTFEREKHYKFIYLSASDLGYRFDKENVPEEEQQKRNKEIQKELEKDLLVQLISLCKRSDIPKSRFRLVPENGAPFLLKSYSFLCGIAALCSGMLAVNKLTQKAVYPGNLSTWPWIGLAVFLGLSVWFWSNRLFQNYRLSKLSIGMDKTYSASAEINPNTLDPESLDTDLHEILYLFERLAKKKHLFKERSTVFVIEDLDRYPSEICIPILTKLKQINNMLNRRFRNQSNCDGMHYQFIYLLNDSIFDASESSQTVFSGDPYKFFDIIIPVLPKLGFTNSSAYLRSIFGESIDHELIEKICNFVYDFRKLRDIENEYRIYRPQYDSKKVSDTCLLAFVIYKVFYKEKYDQLFKTDSKTGVPKSSLLVSLLMPESTEPHKPEKLEGILEQYFKDSLCDDLLHMTEDVKKQYKTDIVVADTKIDIAKTDLSDMDFAGKDLSGRDFSYMVLSRKDFSGANLNGANLEHANLEEALLFGANLREANLITANLFGAVLNDANLQKANLSGAKLFRADLLNAHLYQARLIAADLREAYLTEAILLTANMRAANLFKANLFKANLTGADLREADLHEANLPEADLAAADLRGANLTHAILTGAKYCLDPRLTTQFPEGFDPQAHGMIEVDISGKPVAPPEEPEKAAKPDKPDNTPDNSDNPDTPANPEES